MEALGPMKDGLMAAGKCLKGFCCCLCCCCCGGPILIIVGIVIMTASNSREGKVTEYNNAVSGYTGSADVKADWTGTIGGVATGLVAEQTTVLDSHKDDINSPTVTSDLVAATVPGTPTSITFAVNTVTAATITVNLDPTKSASARCSSSSGCNSATQLAACKVTWGSAAGYLGLGCANKSSVCGACTYQVFHSEYCQVAKKAGSVYALDTSFKACRYPFSSALSNPNSRTSSSATTFSLRTADDPYLALQRITRGRRTFGVTRASQVKLGLIIMIIGIVLLLCVIGLCFLAYKLIRAIVDKVTGDSDEEKPEAGAAVAPQPQQQAGYGQPQQPTQGYPQQAPAPGYQQAPAPQGKYFEGAPPAAV